jgi:hypothetical protein
VAENNHDNHYFKNKGQDNVEDVEGMRMDLGKHDTLE